MRALCLALLCLACACPSVQAQPDASEAAARIQTLVNQADRLMQQNQYEPALALLQQAWADAGAPETAAVARNVLNSIANLYYSTGQLDAAVRYYRELSELDATNGDEQGLSVSLFNLAHALASQGDLAAAATHFRSSLQLSEKLGDTSGAAFTLKAMAVNAQALGNLAAAQQLLQDALERFVSTGDTSQQAAVQRHLGDVALASGAAAVAVEHYLLAVPTLAATAFNSALLHSYRGLSQAYEQLGQLEKALVAQRAYTELLQYDLEQQNTENTQRLQAEFDTQRLADDNARLQLIRTQQALQLEESRKRLQLQLLVLVLGAGIIMLVLGMLLRSRAHSHRMQHLAITDELTQLYNRRAILEKGKDEWLRATRFNQPLACLLFDADHFKSINDSFGHAVGDAVLVAIAEQLRQLPRKTDVVERIGGEEFLLLAPQTDRLQAMALAERIRAGIEACTVAGLQGRRLTVSIGVAGLQGESGIDELVHHADQALYIAKSSGRNRCILFHEKQTPASRVRRNEQPVLQG